MNMILSIIITVATLFFMVFLGYSHNKSQNQRDGTPPGKIKRKINKIPTIKDAANRGSE